MFNQCMYYNSLMYMYVTLSDFFVTPKMECFGLLIFFIYFSNIYTGSIISKASLNRVLYINY